MITAGHVFEQAKAKGLTIAVGLDKGFHALRDCVVSDDRDRHDIGIAKLSDEAIKRISADRFLTPRDTERRTPSRTGVFAYLGYPGRRTAVIDDVLDMKPVLFVGYRTPAAPEGLSNFDDSLHVLVSANATEVTNRDGSPVNFQDWKGATISFPSDMHGVSGAGVWEVLDYRLFVRKRPQHNPRLAGVLTGSYPTPPSFRVTQWPVVTEIICRAFPS